MIKRIVLTDEEKKEIERKRRNEKSIKEKILKVIDLTKEELEYLLRRT